jgi:carboxyl-terminal processing protease
MLSCTCQSQTFFDSKAEWAESTDKTAAEFSAAESMKLDTGLVMSDTARHYLESFFEIVGAHSLRRDSINLFEIRDKIIDQFRHAQSIADCHPAIVRALKELNDHHSFFMPYEQVQAWRSDAEESRYVRTGSGILLQNNIGYISLPAFHSGSPRKMQLFADSLQHLIRSLDQNEIAGWIIDLRKNEGGNCWPMLAGIGPLLGEGVCGYFARGQGEGLKWNYINGVIYEDEKEFLRVAEPYHPKQEYSRVAVLTGPWTASSGEIVAVSFIGRPNTKRFGEPTFGVSTGNQDFTLSDGSMLFLTTSVYADRNKHTYGGKIVPDEIIPFSEGAFSPDRDPVLKRAIEWLTNNN